MFKRKIYDKMLEWKRDSNGKTALLIEGARRVGKSTVVEEFARKEYESYILIDFPRHRKRCEACLMTFQILTIFFTAAAAIQNRLA